MLSRLYDIFIAFITFVLGLLGFDLKKKSVSFSNDVKDVSTDSSTVTSVTTSVTTAATSVVENVLAVVAESKEETTPVTESA